MLLLPISRSNFDRRTGVEPFEGEGFQFLRSLLISTDEALQVGFDAESLGFRLGADFRFEVRMNGNTHKIPQFACFRSDSTPTAKRFSSGKGVFYVLHISGNPTRRERPLLRKRCTIGHGLLHASNDARNSV